MIILHQRERMGRFVTLTLVLSSITCAQQLASAGEASDHVDFATHVQPILAEHCLVCHGQDQAEAELRLDIPDVVGKTLDSGSRAIVAHNAQASELIRRVRSNGADRMPPEGSALSEAQIAVLQTWIEQGAEWQTHWAYRPLDDSLSVAAVDERADVSVARSTSRHRIDQYVARELQAQRIAPSPVADRRTLVRRLSLDLLGLPPKPEAVVAFVNDHRPDAYQRMVDRLLASPQFGERWGRHWLDKARYADSDGYEKDRSRPDAYRYRDWVIAAINRDLPFDQFTVQQLAGDLLPDSTEEQRLATAFHRQTLTNTEGGTNQEQWRVAAVMDRTETLGTVWLGLTVGCARCHTHKYDAITHAEYYQLYAYFNNADEVNSSVTRSEVARREYDQKIAAYRQTLEQLDATVAQIKDQLGYGNQKEWEATLKEQSEAETGTESSSEVSPSQEAESLFDLAQLADDQRSKPQNERLRKAYESAAATLVAAEKALANHQKTEPSYTMKVRVIGQRTKDARTTHILRRGNFDQPLEEVSPATLNSLGNATEGSDVPERLRLARWLVSGSNSLVPRVVANHVWQNLFGEGLVITPNDFGVRGEPPTYPRLLDHLALEYMRLGWSRKALIRYIVTSHTYRQSSVHREDLTEADPSNRWLARQNRFRVEAELIRDLSLSVSGLLTNRIGGPSVFPPMPPEVAAISYANNFKWNTSQGDDRYRRGLYTYFKRTSPHPTLMTFDCPDANTTNVKRNRSNTPLAALTVLNNEVYVEAASALADRLLAIDVDDARRIEMALGRCLSRSAQQVEIDALRKVLEDAREYFAANSEAAESVAIGPLASESDVSERAAWAVMVRVVLNLDEFVTRE